MDTRPPLFRYLFAGVSGLLLASCGCLQPPESELRAAAEAICDAFGATLVSYNARYDENGCFTGMGDVTCRDGGLEIPTFGEP